MDPYSEVNTEVKPVFRGHLYIPGKVSQQDRCPFTTGSLTWGRLDPSLNTNLRIRSRLMEVSLKTGFTFFWCNFQKVIILVGVMFGYL